MVYEGGSVVSQARSLWRLELARTKWSGGYINWFHPMRMRHITTGRYLGINEHNEITLVHRSVTQRYHTRAPVSGITLWRVSACVFAFNFRFT